MNYLFNLASLFGLTFRVLTIALVSVFDALSSHLPFNFSKQ